MASTSVARFLAQTASRQTFRSCLFRSRVAGQSTRLLSASAISSKRDWAARSATASWMQWQAQRSYASERLTKADVESRVLTVCKAFDKITADKVTMDSHFINELGLDSLDHVEVIMAMEDEFGFEIADEHAEKLLTPAKIAEYIIEHETVVL